MMSFNFTTEKIAGDGNSEKSPFNLCFDDAFWKDACPLEKDDVSAIYFFYSTWKDSAGHAQKRLLYIGKALNLKKRVSQHEITNVNIPRSGFVDIKKLDDYLCDPDDVCRKCFYAYAKVDGRKLERFEAAAIKVFQPIINIKNKKTLGCHLESWFECTGKYAYENGRVFHATADKQEV